MPTASAAFWPLATFIVSLVVLAWLSRQVSISIQLPVYYLTRSKDAPGVAIFLVFLPGVVVHETAHWVTARLLGLRTGKFRVWPTRQGRHIGLGSVSVQSKGVLLDSLVGLAPLLAGSVLAGLIGRHIFQFDANAMADTLAQDGLAAGLQTFRRTLGAPDGALWAYLLFAIANAMMPSASDREPLKPVLLYAGLAAAVYVLLGLPLTAATQFMLWLTPALQILSSAFLFVIVLDVAALVLLYALRLLVAR